MRLHRGLLCILRGWMSKVDGALGGRTSERADGQLAELADPGRFQGALDISSQGASELLGLLRTMLLVRRAEEKIGALVSAGEVQCPCHLAIGQEACAVGVATVLDGKRDRVFGGHRSHGHFLALGGGIDQLMAEVFGRTTGCSRGMGGSMHLTSREHGLVGTVPIVGATVPMALGAGLSAKLDGTGGVAVSFFGDGAMEEGVIHESLNFASAHHLPVLFVCENNFFASHLHIGQRQAFDRVARFGEAHGVASESLDGNDVVIVKERAGAAVERARRGEGPTLLELVTYRWRGHVGPREDLDVGVKRSGALPQWKQRDPILRLSRALIDTRTIDGGALDELDRHVCEEVESATVAARSAPFPQPDATLRFLHAAPHT